jgi:hypothetical protein
MVDPMVEWREMFNGSAKPSQGQGGQQIKVRRPGQGRNRNKKHLTLKFVYALCLFQNKMKR